MTPRGRPWLANGWLLALGVVLAGAGMLDADTFVSAVRWLYLRLPIHAAVFRADLAEQTRILHAACVPAALALVLAWGAASARGVSVLAALAGGPGGATPREAWRRRIVTALVAYAILLAPVRLLRDGLREGELAGLSYAERRLHVYGRHTLEPDYGTLEAFRQRSRGDGAVLVLRRGRFLDFADVFAASYLFPQRVYVARVPGCTPQDAARAAESRPDVRFVQLACEAGPFEPQPLDGR